MPAARIGLTDRGILVNGAAADVIVFDPERFRETGTLEDPNRLAEGMVHVIINGEVILENGQYTGHRNGHVLRRG
jgi:N-acyl-D-amino-acid deacylase